MAVIPAKTGSSSSSAAGHNPRGKTSSVSTSAANSASKFGNVRTAAISRSEAQADSGDLANGRYRR